MHGNPIFSNIELKLQTENKNFCNWIGQNLLSSLPQDQRSLTRLGNARRLKQ